jgi:hypothetical protein
METFVWIDQESDESSDVKDEFDHGFDAGSVSARTPAAR